MAVVHWYHTYGQLLASEIPFPELREAPAGSSTWTLRQGPIAPPTADPSNTLLGQQVIYQGCSARLFRTPNGLRITVDDTGTFDLTDNGSLIVWCPSPGGTVDFGRAHFLGRVLATAMHFDGTLVLHGSAVSYSSGAVIFLAPKHTGKSTLALALTLSGARLISDDTITVVLPESDKPVIWPGVHSLRLFSDSASRLGGVLPVDRREDGKYLVADLPADRLESRISRLSAVYLLAAAESIAGGRAIARRSIPQPLGAAAMVGQGKISEMLGSGEAPALLQRAARIATQVPVYQLAVHRDLSRLAEVTDQLAAWHTSVSAPS